jgi:hypothetical protein
MGHLLRYDQLSKEFKEAKALLKDEMSVSANSADRTSVEQKIQDLERLFEQLSENSRHMTFAMMEGDSAKAAPYFEKVDRDLKEFKADVDAIELLFVRCCMG